MMVKGAPPPPPSSLPNWCAASLEQSLRPHQAALSSRTCAKTSSSKECILSNPTSLIVSGQQNQVKIQRTIVKHMSLIL